jgi:hypothetical protein
VTPDRLPALAEVRPLVEREWANVRRKAAGDAFYDGLRAKYRVTIKMPGRGAEAPAGAGPGGAKP